MSDYPNREHANADKAAARRALRALDEIGNEIGILRRRVGNGTATDDDTGILSEKVRALTGYLGILGALREVRKWHAADLEDKG